MPTEISKTPKLEVENIDSKRAKEILTSLRAQLKDTNGTPKSGTLNIVRRNGTWQIRRQSAWSRFWNWGFQKSLGPEETARILKILVGKAKEELRPKATGPLTKYLQGRGGAESSEIQLYLGTALAEKREDFHTTGLMSPKSDEQILEKLGADKLGFAPTFTTYMEQRSSDSGGMGSIAPIGDKLLKIENHPLAVKTGPMASVRGRELSAAYLHSFKTGKNVPGVIRPTHLIFRNKRGGNYLVPGQHVKAFLRTMPEHVNLDYIGQVMPKVPGRNLFEALIDEDPQKRPSLDDQKIIARQMHEILTSLAHRGFVHQDVKPENLIWDSETQKLTLVDNGFLQKLSKHQDKPTVSNLKSGTRSTVSPLVSKGPHSSPVDAFSTGMTLLQIAAGSKADKNNKDGLDAQALLNFLRFKKSAEQRLQNKNLQGLSESPYLETWFHSDYATQKLQENIRTGFLERIGNTNAMEPTLENYAHHLIQASFLPSDQYKNRMEALANHPFLAEN